MACSQNNKLTFSDREICSINTGHSLMRVLKSDNPDDLKNLRLKSDVLTEDDIKCNEFGLLKQRMLLTVLDPKSTGVGIAAPQVGINKRLIAVKRFDKENEPFEFYSNPIISFYSEEKSLGQEGCLSVPDRSESILRAKQIIIEYTNEDTFEVISETISGFTAVIFQHEIDHLEGILYIDRL